MQIIHKTHTHTQSKTWLSSSQSSLNPNSHFPETRSPRTAPWLSTQSWKAHSTAATWQMYSTSNSICKAHSEVINPLHQERPPLCAKMPFSAHPAKNSHFLKKMNEVHSYPIGQWIRKQDLHLWFSSPELNSQTMNPSSFVKHQAAFHKNMGEKKHIKTPPYLFSMLKKINK